MKQLTLFLFAFLLLACQPEKQSDNGTDNSMPELSEELSGYLDNFSKTELPLEIRACFVDVEGLPLFESEEYAKYASEYMMPYGQIPTNGDYLATITLSQGECYFPVLTTYTPDGKVIDQESIAVGLCPTNCVNYCSEYMILRDDFSFYTADTLNVYECDDMGDPIPGSERNYVIYKEGKLLQNGKIEISEEIEKELESIVG